MQYKLIMTDFLHAWFGHNIRFTFCGYCSLFISIFQWLKLVLSSIYFQQCIYQRFLTNNIMF